jgi:hypothetical protein
VAAYVPDIFWHFYLVKYHKFANNSTTAKAEEKISSDLEYLEIKKIFDVCWTKFKNNQIWLNKTSCRFLSTIKLFTGQKILILQIKSETYYSKTQQLTQKLFFSGQRSSVKPKGNFPHRWQRGFKLGTSQK